MNAYRPLVLLAVLLPVGWWGMPATAQSEAEPSERVLPAEADPLPPDEASAPIVSIRKLDNGDVVEEYRVGGVLNMVRVRPARGPAYLLLDTNGDGRLDRKDSEGPVAPVYWTLYEWN
ncbi:MAG: DUF2782 domain-containing protein [Lysobacteraceae bacterium]